MKREFSAGGIVFKKLKVESGKLKVDNVLWLVAQHSQHKGWVFPKGLIGDEKEDETRHETAVREVEEETGVKAKIISELKKPVTYFYTFEGEKIFKKVYYFLMEYVSGDIKDHDWEMSAVEWLETDKVLERLTYKSDKEAFRETVETYIGFTHSSLKVIDSELNS